MRRRAGVALPQRRRRRFLGDGSGHQQPRARPQVAARQRRAVHAHDPARRQPRAPRHLDRRPLPERGRRRDLPGVQQRRRRRLRARSRIPSSASACTRSRATRTRPAGSTCRTTAAGPNGTGPAGRARTSACCAATTTARPGARSRRGCRPTSASRSSCTRTTPTRSTSCRSSRRRAPAPAARPRSGAARTAAARGSKLAKGLPKKESYFTVLRDAMDIDELKSPALYFGTTTGQLWIGPRRRRGVGVPVRLAAADPLREGRGRVTLDQRTMLRRNSMNETGLSP